MSMSVHLPRRPSVEPVSMASPLVTITGQDLLNCVMTSELENTRCRDLAKVILAKP